MRHQQILTKLGAHGLVQAMDEDVARWLGVRMLGPGRSRTSHEAAVLPGILARWRCLLDADDVKPWRKDIARVALATVLHRYGLADPDITAAAETSIDELNAEVALSDAFARQSPAIKELLRSAPTPLTRRPRQPKKVTFYRQGDVISYQLDGRFHGAYVRELTGANEYPIIEFYAGTFTEPPTAAELWGGPAATGKGRARFAVLGMTYLPDPANQIVAVPGQCEPPRGGEPEPGGGLFTMSDLFNLQRQVRLLFEGDS